MHPVIQLKMPYPAVNGDLKKLIYNFRQENSSRTVHHEEKLEKGG
jgi:hypothetical protein